MSGRPIVCISNIDWDFLWQRHQIFMSGFASQGRPVLFVEKLDTGRAPRLLDVSRIGARVRNVGRQLIRGTRRERGVTIISPPVLPAGWTGWVNRSIVLPLLAAQIRRAGFANPVVWTYSPAPNSMRLVELLRPSCLVYDCVNRLRGYTHASQALLVSEERLARSADLVITDAGILFEEQRALSHHCYQVEPGVEYERFCPAAGDGDPPEELRDVPSPRLGFFGSLDDRLDLPLLEEFAARHPEWSLVLIGPAKSALSSLGERPNVHQLGAKPYELLPRYLHALDVLTIPYLVNEFTRGIIPAKLFEMLATGKPVVVTPLPELLPYASHVTVTDREGFSDAVDRARADDGPGARARRLELARKNSWAARLETITTLLDQALIRRGLAA